MTAPPLTVEALERWTAFGAHWRVVARSAERVVVELRSCTGEPVERHESTEPTLVDYVRQATEGLP